MTTPVLLDIGVGFGVSVVTLVVLCLLIGGVLLSAIPGLPGTPLSLAGVYLYWWSSGYTAPSTLLLVGLTLLGVLALAAGLFGDVVAAKLGGASMLSAVGAGIVGLLLLVTTGPGVAILGMIVTVFLLEYRRQRSFRSGASAALAVVLGTFATRVFKILLNATILVVMLVVIV